MAALFIMRKTNKDIPGWIIKNINVYEFVEDREIHKGYDDFGKYTISESLFAEMRAEVEKSIADFLGGLQ